MPRLIHTADLHLGALRRVSEIPDAAKMDRWHGILSFIFGTARKQGVDLVVIAGDVFDHKQVEPRIKDMFLQALLHYNDLRIVIIPGNHDQLEYAYTSLHFLHLLQAKGKLGHVTFAEVEPRVVELDDVVLALIPPVTDDGDGYVKLVKRTVASVPQGDKPIVVVGHECILGTCDDSGYKMTKGVKLPKNLSERVRYFALGDIHKHQSVGLNSRAWYSGPPAQVKFSDATRKGVLLVDTDASMKLSMGVRFIPNTHPKVRPLVTVDSDNPEDLRNIPEDAWVSLKTSDVQAMHTVAANIVKTTPRRAQGETVSIDHQSPLSGLRRWLKSRMAFSGKEARGAEELIRGLMG